MTDPAGVVGLAQAQLSAVALGTLDAGAARTAFVDGLLRRAGARSPLAELLAADHPQASALYARLESAADMTGPPTAPSMHLPAVRIDAARGALAVNAVLVGAETDGVHDAELVARPAGGAPPGEAADAGVDQLPGELVAVVFAGRPRPVALTAAVAALQDDPRLGAVLLAAGDAPAPLREHDPLDCVDAGAAIVLRREAWLVTRGFAATDPAEGLEAWSFAVGCMAREVPVARIAGGLDGPPLARAEDAARRSVLERHPALAARRLLAAEAERDRAAEQQNLAAQRAQDAEGIRDRAAAQLELATRRARDAAADRDRAAAQLELASRRAQDAEAERDRVNALLEQLQATRSWHLVTGWWRLRTRLSGRRRAV